MEWKEQFENEFGIHFKDAKGELQFALDFIDDLLEDERGRIMKIAEEIYNRNPESNGRYNFYNELKAELNR